MDFVGMNIAASGGFAWQEHDRIKSDMMLVPDRWTAARVSTEALRAKCEAIGMDPKEVAEVADWLSKRQAGRTLRPNHIKDFRWPDDPQ